MKILFSIEDSPISQDCYAEEKNNLLSWTFDIGKLDELQTILHNSLLMNLHEDDYFNLRLWIEVLNRFDATLSALLKWFFRANEKSICVDDWHKNDNNGTTDIDLYDNVHAVILQILTWTRNLLSHSFNKSTYNSVELVVQILKQTSHDDLALCSLEVLSALSTPPLNHRNVFTYSHTTVLHKNTDYTLPLFDILLAGNNLGTFTASNIANGHVSESTVDGEAQAGPVPRSKWWFNRMGLSLQQRASAAASDADISSITNTISDSLHDPWTWYRCYLQAFQVVVRTHRDMVDVSNFFNHKPQLQHDLLYILRSNAIHWTDEAADASSGFIPTDIRVLATHCVSALLERSENHFTNAQKEGEYSGAVRLIGPFDRILQGQLGIDGVQIQGLVPSLLRQELQWLSTLNCSSDEESATNCDRLLHLEHLLLLVMTSLPLPRSMQSYMNNGVVDSILAVVKRHDLSDLRTLNALTAAEKTTQTAVAYEFHWQMFCVSSLLVQVLDMIISAKKGAMESFYTLGGPTLVLERLKHESAQVGPDIIDSYVQQQGSKHFVAIRNSSIPLCCQSLHLSLTAMLDSLLNNSNNRELRAGSHSSLNQMDLIRSPLFTETVVSVCEGIASVCAAILATVVRMLCELINNDNATPAVINLFLLQGPVIRKAYAAVSSPHIRHDIDTMNSVLNLMTGLCIKEEGLRLIHANNPFKILLGIFHDVHYLLSESLLLHPSFVLQIGSQCGDLLRSNPQLSGLFADTILAEMKAVLRIVEEFNARHNASREDGTGKTISDSDAGKDDTYTEVILGNMMIAILMCFDNVVERSKEFAKDFVAKDGLDCLYGFLTHLFGSRRHLLVNLSSKIGVTNEDKPGNNQVRRILLHSYTKLLSHQTQEVMLDISKRIQHETEQLSMALAAFHLVHPSEAAEEVVEAAEVAVEEDEEEEDSEAHKSAVASSSSKRGKGDKKPRVVKKKIGNVKNLRAKFAQEKSSKADKEIAAASEAGQLATSKKSSKDFSLHRILGTVTDSTADLLAFDYTGSHELFAVLYSLLRLEALYILFSDVNEFANSVANYHAHKYLPLFIPAIVGASMVNVNCVSEIARAHEVIVSNYLSRAGTSSSSVGVSFDVYILPGKHKVKVRDNYTDSEAGRNRSAVRGNSSQIDTNHFVHALERICSEDSKSLTFFKLEESAFIRKREIDGVPNMEVVGLRPSTLPCSSAGFRRDQSISMYRLGKNVLRSVCNAFNDMVGVVLQSFKLEHDAAVFRSHMDKMRPALLDQCIRKVLQWGYDPQSRWREEGRLTASLLEEQHVFSVQKHLQFKYCIDTCTTFFGLRGFPDHSSNSAAVTMAGNPLAFASMYSHDNGELFELVIKACCDTILGCFVPTTPSNSENSAQSTVMDVEGSSSTEADLQVQQRICCIALASKLILFLKNVLHCLAFQDTAWGKEIHNRHGYPKPVFVKYNCFIKLYTHLRTVWSHDQLYSLPSHMCLAVVELMTQFEECGIKTFIACGQHDSSDLPSQFKYLEELRNSVREDSCRMLLHLVQFGGLHYEEKHASFRHAQSADVTIAPALWPLNVLAAENKMKRVDFLRQLMELYVKGQTTQISLENKFYRCETTLENEMRSVEKGICIGAEKQYKVMSGVLAMLFCRLATILHDHSQSAGGAIDFLALEGVLTATNSALYATGNLHAHSCSPFQNAIMLLLTTIPEFLSVFSDIAELIGKVTGGINDQPLCVQAVHHRWLLPAYLFLDTALQPFLTNAPLISYCDLFGRYLAKGVQLFSSVYFQYDCGALFCNSADDGVISALLLTTPVQHFYAGDRKKSASLAEVVAAAEDAATINAEFQTPMAQLRSEAGDGLVHSCLAVVGAITKDRAQASEFTPLLLQATLQVLSHLARETSAAQLILQPTNLATVLEVGVGFERLPLYLTAIVQASVEQQSEEALRDKMRDCVMLAAEAFQEQGGAATASDQKMKAKLGKAMGKFVSIVEPLMMRNPGVFLTVITDPALLSMAHNPVDYLPSYLQPGCAAQMNTWQPLLSSVGQLFMQRITALFAQSRSSSEGVASSEADDVKGLLGDVLVSLADLLHSLAPPQGHYLLSQLVVSGEAAQPLMYFLLNELLPVFSVTERDGAAVASTLEWHKKKRFNVKSSPSELARAKAYSSGVYLLLSVAAIQGSTRQQVLSEVSNRLTIAVQTISETGRCDERGVVTLLDFVNAVDVPPYSSRLSGVTFCVPTDGILSALSVLGVHSSLIALQDRVNASGSSSLLSPSLASAINLMMMRGVTAANELSRFVAACKEQIASDEVLSSNSSSSSSSSSVYNTQFWSDNLYLFTNIHTVARRWVKQTDKQNKKLPASVISADNRSMVVSTANGTEVRLLFDGVGGNDWQRDGSVSGSSRVEEDAPASESHSVSESHFSPARDDLGEDAEDEDGDDGSDDDDDGFEDVDDDGEGFSDEDDGFGGGFDEDDEHRDFIDDEDEEEGHMAGHGFPLGMHVDFGGMGMHMGGGAGNGPFWQHIDMNNAMDHMDDLDGSDMSLNSEDDEDGGGDDDLDEFDMMSAPPDSDDDEDSELNDAGSIGDDNTVDNSMIYVDESDGGDAQHQNSEYNGLPHEMKMDNDIYHMVGYLYYSEGFEQRSLFADILAPLLGEVKETHFGRSDFQTLASTAHQARVALHLPCLSRRSWNAEKDYTNGLLNCNVMTPFVTYLLLKAEFATECAEEAIRDGTFFAALEHVLKTLAAIAEKSVASSTVLAYNFRSANRMVAAVRGVSYLVGEDFKTSIASLEGGVSVELPAMGSLIATAFVSNIAQYSAQLVTVNFNRLLNLKSMSLYKLCLASNQVVRNYQMSLIFMYSSPERTSEWDRALLTQLVHLLDVPALDSNVMLLVFEVLCYQCDEMYRCTEKIVLGLRNAMLSPPIKTAVQDPEGPSAVGCDAMETAVEDEAVTSGGEVPESASLSVMTLMLDVLCRAVEEGLPADSIKEVLRMLSHVITLCERESNSVPVKVTDEHPLHLYVPALRSETVSGLASLFLRTDMFVSNEHYVVHYCRLMDFLCLNKANWVSLIACVPVIGAALMTTVSADMRTMLETARQHISLESKVPSLAEPPQSPTKLTSSSSSFADTLPSPVDISSDGAPVGDAVKPPRPTILFHQPNAELRLVHFLDLLQSTTKAMNHSGVIPKKSLPKTTAEERPALNGTPEDLKLLNDSLIHLQESVAWEHLVEVLRLLNHLIEEKPSPETAVQVVKHKISGYGTIAAEHQRMFPLIESLFQAATLPTVLFDHVTSAAYSVAQNVVVLDKVGADGTKVPSTVTKTPMLLRDVSLSGTKLSKHKDANAKNALKLGDCYVTHKLFTLVEENKKLLNTKLNQNIRLLELSLQALRTVPELSKFLDFSVKRKYLRLQIKRLRRPMKWRDMTPEQRVAENVDDSDDEGEEGGMEDEEADNVSVNVDRDDVLNQSFHCVQNYTPRQLMRGTFHITFNNEPGMDAGGLTREWLLILTRSIFKPAYALFSLSGDGVTYQPNPHSGANPEHLDYFKFIGRLVAKAIVDNVLLDVHFTRSFYKHILRVPISFSDLEAFDKDYFKNLNTLLQHPIDDLGVELTFTATANVFGTEVCSSLVEDGENVPVTDENKTEYVRLIAHHCLTTSFQKQIDAFLAGFHELLPHHLFSHFDPSELELLISGLPEIDIEDLVAHTTYTGYKQSDPVIQRFWAVLRKFSSEEKALFVQFVTGTSKVPLDGFQSLQGSEGVQMFSVHKAYNPGLLPTAHTCFNQLDLPEYASEEVMREKLVLAIRECSEGFGFQ